MATTRTDPYNGYNFAVEIDGITSAGFKSASGLDTTVSSLPYREGTDAQLNQRQQPGMLTFSNVTLTRGITSDRSLWDWHDQVANGSLTRKSMSIVLYDNRGNEKIRWNLVNAWPTKWSGPSFDAAADAIAIETLELVHEGVEVQAWS